MNIKLERELLSCPGDTILETLAHTGKTVEELATSLNYNLPFAVRLIKGEERITPIIAKQLELYLGIDAQFWINYENNYRTKLAEIEKVERSRSKK